MGVEIEIDWQTEVFTHLHDDGTYRHFAIQAMQKFADGYGANCDQIIKASCPIEERIVRHSRDNMGVEPDRLARLEHPYLNMPLLAIFWQDNKTMTIVDGHHRLVKLHQLGRGSFNAYIFKYPFWEQFLLPLPNDKSRFTRRSGVIEAERGEPIHHCHAIGCNARTRPERLMCFKHWSMVPKSVQRLVLEHYRVGQTVDKSPSYLWVEAAKKAISIVAEKEGVSMGKNNSNTNRIYLPIFKKKAFL